MKNKSNTSTTSADIKSDYFSTDVAWGMDFSKISDNTVISRSNNGEITCIFSDDTWYLPAFAYSVIDKPKFDFLQFYRTREDHIEDLRVIKKTLLMKMFAKSHSGLPLRLGTLHSHRYTLLLGAKFCQENKIPFKELFVRPDIFENFLEILPSQPRKSIISIIRTLLPINEKERGFPIDGSLLHIAKKKNWKAVKSKQHPIIPSRILLLKYSQYTGVLDEFSENKENIKSILDKCGSDMFYGRTNSTYLHRKPFLSSPAVCAEKKPNPDI